MMIAYAVLMGCALAFVTPARDGLLSQVAMGRVQRTVMLASMTQFGLQVVGFAVVALADVAGPEPILLVQALVLAVGVVAFSRIQNQRHGAHVVAPRLLHSLLEGGRIVFSSPALRVIVAQNVAMGMFFMGSYMVTMPLLVREIYAGSARDLAIMNACNSLGLVITIVLLLRLGDVHRQGRALLLSQAIGALVLGAAAFAPTFGLFALALFLWGVCGGVAMTMSRTIMQEQAPDALRARVMSFYSFSFMGASPLGALLCGFLAREIGPQATLIFACGVMFALMLLISATSGLWRLRGPQADLAPA
jgi:hypothetical protein